MAEAIVGVVGPADFYVASAGATAAVIVDLISAGSAVDHVTVAAGLRRHTQWALDAMGGPAGLVSLQVRGGTSVAAVDHARIIARLARARRLTLALESAQQLARAGDDQGALEGIEAAREMAVAGESVVAGVELDEFLASSDPEYDWIVPGLLERGDRLMLTGGEGMGKSTLIRQIAITAGAGLHPFDFSPIEPVKVLLVDAENSTRHLRRSLRPLRIKAGGAIAGNMVVVSRPAGIDLGDATERAWLAAEICAARPDLVAIGPVYKLMNGGTDQDREIEMKPILSFLDTMRIEHGFCLVLEAHQPHGEGGKKRAGRPIGTSMWMRWPEFGLNLGDDGALTHWRGARDVRDWPASLKRGGAWPWTISAGPAGEGRPVVLMERVSVTLEEGGEMSQRGVLEATSGNRDGLIQALALLVGESCVGVEKVGKANRYASLKPFRAPTNRVDEADDGEDMEDDEMF